MNLENTMTGRALKSGAGAVVENKGKISLAGILTTVATLTYFGINPIDLAVHHTASYEAMSIEIGILRKQTSQMEFLEKENEHLIRVAHLMAQKMFLAEMITVEELTDILVDPNE